jgi:amidase
MLGIEDIASPYGFGQPASTPDEFGQLQVFTTLMDVGYASFLQNWTFPEGDERRGMSTLKEMAAWNDANNSTTGALGNNSIWRNPTSGQDFYDMAIETNGTLGESFWAAFGWGRLNARRAIDDGLVHVAENGTAIAMDGLLIPNGDNGGFDNPCASIPSYAGYPVASVPIGQSGYSVPFGICIYGTYFGEAKLIKVASAMEDLFKWSSTPMYYNYEVGVETPDTLKEAPYPGFACSEDSLELYGCVEAAES